MGRWAAAGRAGEACDGGGGEGGAGLAERAVVLSADARKFGSEVYRIKFGAASNLCKLRGRKYGEACAGKNGAVLKLIDG